LSFRHPDVEEEEEELCIGKTNNTNSDLTTCTKVLCRAARIAETITAGRPTYIKFIQAVNKTTPSPNQYDNMVINNSGDNKI